LSNAHLWAETYDRKLTDIFAVETDIAKTIADTLQAKLTGSEKQMMAAQSTSDTAAYELYHKGRSLWEKRSGDNIPKAIACYDESARQLRKTLEIDPTSFYAHYNLGIVLQAKGDLSGAIAEYEKAKQLGDNPLVSTLCAQAKALAGEKDAALRMLTEFDKIS